jgi:vesicle coat complex subunit
VTLSLTLPHILNVLRQTVNRRVLAKASAVGVQIYTTFFCRQNEPSYIRALKLEILSTIADETSAYDIATELTEYVNDIDEQLARDAVKAVGCIAIEVMCPCVD